LDISLWRVMLGLLRIMKGYAHGI